MAVIDLSEYRKIGEEETDDIYRKRTKGSPKFIAVLARGPAKRYDNDSTGIVVDRDQIERTKRVNCRNPGLTGRTAASRFRGICSGKHT